MAEPRGERERRFLELVQANRARIARIARAYAGADWPDLQQEILLQIWKGLDRFEGRSSGHTWLYRVALNTAMTWRRRRAAGAPAEPQTESTPEPAAAIAARDAVHVLEEFMATLNAVDRAILLLYLENGSYADIAQVTGLTESNVGVRLHRIKRTFKDRYIEG